jgi:hypothetical protein
VSGKLLDSATAANLFNLHALAVSEGLALDIHFDPLRPTELAWIVQLWDHAEREVVSARSPTLAMATSQVLTAVRCKALDSGSE